MKKTPLVMSVPDIAGVILTVRGQKVILDSDLAAIYGASTKRLNEQVKRNTDRFPRDFVFQLSLAEKAEVVANCDHLARLKFPPVSPRTLPRECKAYPAPTFENRAGFTERRGRN